MADSKTARAASAADSRATRAVAGTMPIRPEQHYPKPGHHVAARPVRDTSGSHCPFLPSLSRTHARTHAHTRAPMQAYAHTQAAAATVAAHGARSRAGSMTRSAEVTKHGTKTGTMAVSDDEEPRAATSDCLTQPLSERPEQLALCVLVHKCWPDHQGWM